MFYIASLYVKATNTVKSFKTSNFRSCVSESVNITLKIVFSEYEHVATSQLLARPEANEFKKIEQTRQKVPECSK